MKGKDKVEIRRFLFGGQKQRRFFRSFPAFVRFAL
jgi:hypothetical protein